MSAAKTVSTHLVVIGSGPGGYTAAFRAADLLAEKNQKVVLVEAEDMGGVCLNVGCIPSKALLHAAKVIDEAKHMSQCGIDFGKPKIDLKKLVNWKQSVVNNLTGGLSSLAKMRKVDVIAGYGQFISPNELSVKSNDGEETLIKFENAIVAVGSQPINLPFIPDDPRIMDSTGALELAQTDGEMLVIGGGIIGMEMATVYEALGSKVTIVELAKQIVPGVDPDIVKPLFQRMKDRCNFMLETKVTNVDAKKDGLMVTFEGKGAPTKAQRFDRILVAVGRKPNGALIAAEKAGVKVDERGFIPVDKQMRTNVPHIFAIGDVNGNPMLAHKAIPEGRVAAEVIAGKKHFFEPACIPNVAYTDPEIAWVGLSETEAKAQGIDYDTGVFPWMASGRSLSNGRNEGITKILFDKKSHRVLGAGIVGTNAGDLIAEVGLAIEMGCEAEDVSLTIHPHPTLSETIAMATEVFEGTVTDLPNKKKKDTAKT